MTYFSNEGVEYSLHPDVVAEAVQGARSNAIALLVLQNVVMSFDHQKTLMAVLFPVLDYEEVASRVMLDAVSFAADVRCGYDDVSQTTLVPVAPPLHRELATKHHSQYMKPDQR